MNAPFDGQLGFRPAGTARSIKARKRAAVAPDSPRSREALRDRGRAER